MKEAPGHLLSQEEWCCHQDAKLQVGRGQVLPSLRSWVLGTCDTKAPERPCPGASSCAPYALAFQGEGPPQSDKAMGTAGFTQEQNHAAATSSLARGQHWPQDKDLP